MRPKILARLIAVHSHTPSLGIFSQNIGQYGIGARITIDPTVGALFLHLFLSLGGALLLDTKAFGVVVVNCLAVLVLVLPGVMVCIVIAGALFELRQERG